MIKIKSPQQIEEMKIAGSLSKAALRRAGSLVRPGISPAEIDAAVEGFIRLHRGTPTFKGYGGFPGSICSSVNEQVVHGIPSPSVILQEGDDEARALCECTRDCLKAGIEAAVPGNHLGDIGAAVQELAEGNGYGVVRDYVGHGVGRVMHEEPSVPNYGRRHHGVKLQVGMVIAIEPMITAGSWSTYVLPNRWTVVTDDGSLAAHYENTIAITKDGPVILTEDDGGPWCSMEGGV